MVIADGYSILDTLAVTDVAVYTAGCPACTDHQDLLRCPTSGCPVPVPVMATTTSRFADIVVGNTHAFWRESTDAMVHCLHSDCAATAGSLPSSAFGGDVVGIAVTGNTVYVKPAGTTIGSELRTCSEMGCGATTILTNSNRVTPPFRVHGGNAYWLADTPNGKQPLVCPLANCLAATFSSDTGATEIDVDNSGVYWIIADAGTLRTCPLGGCPPTGPITLASNRVNPKQLTLGAGFVYWLEGNTIVKVAKH